MTTTTTTHPRFYTEWMDTLRTLTIQLTTPPPSSTQTPPDSLTHPLVHKITDHYSSLYHAKSLTASSDALTLFSAPWATSLEKSLHWVAGFRPTTLFHLIYTESSARFGLHLLDILRGLRTGDLGELSPSQLSRVSLLQCSTVEAENVISARHRDWQDALIDLDWGASLLLCDDEAIDRRVAVLREVAEDADRLRMETIRSVVDMLTPQQAAEFLVAVAELLFGIRSWGLNHDKCLPGSKSKSKSRSLNGVIKA